MGQFELDACPQDSDAELNIWEVSDAEFVGPAFLNTLQLTPPKPSKREKRQAHKAHVRLNKRDKRVIKHEAAHTAVLNIIEGRGIEEAFGPVAEISSSDPITLDLDGETLDAIAITQRIFERAPLYATKYAPQELSLIGKILEVVKGDLAGVAVLDIGAGNGNLAALTSLILGIPAFCVDKYTPRDELCAENFPLPADVKLVRVEADIGDFTCADLRQLCDQYRVDRVVFIGKHLCGLGTDLAIEFVNRLTCGDTLAAGCIFATCCWNKIPDDGGGVQYLDMYRECDCMGQFLPGEATEARIIEAMGKSTSWKCAANSNNNIITDEMVAHSLLYEALLQAPRRRRLDKLFPPCREEFFTPESVTLQNRCLVAPSGFDYRPSLAVHLRKALRRTDLPICLKPRGLVSIKFDYDGT